MSVDAILYKDISIMDTCILVYMHTLSYTNLHTYTHNVFPTVYSCCDLVISSCHKSYQQCQQYIDILLNDRKLEIYYHKKKKKIGKWNLQ